MHWPQRMQTGFSTVRFSSSEKASSAAVPLPHGTFRSYWARPIIGPPMMIFHGVLAKPPVCSNTHCIGVPTRTRTFFGAAMAEPDTVTTRSMAGRPSYAAR